MYTNIILILINVLNPYSKTTAILIIINPTVTFILNVSNPLSLLVQDYTELSYFLFLFFKPLTFLFYTLTTFLKILQKLSTQ